MGGGVDGRTDKHAQTDFPFQLLRSWEHNSTRCLNVQVMARTSLIYDHFDLHLTPVTLTFNLPEKMFQMALLLQDNNCTKLFLKSMHECTSYGPDKLNV